VIPKAFDWKTRRSKQMLSSGAIQTMRFGITFVFLCFILLTVGAMNRRSIDIRIGNGIKKVGAGIQAVLSALSSYPLSHF
jgi:hypothetical protein